MTTSCRSTRRSIPAIRAARCSTSPARSIGINTAIYSPNGGSVGIGFAIPSNLASNVVAQLRDHGTVARGWLGVQMQPMTASLAKAMGRDKEDGVLVNEVQPNSPAEAAKVMQGDVITAYNGTAIKTPRYLAMAVANTKAVDQCHADGLAQRS